MNQILSLVLAILLCSTLPSYSQNVEFTVQGHVHFTDLHIPLPNVEVRVVSIDGTTLTVDTTDELGHYSAHFQSTGTVNDSLVLVVVTDPCTGDNVTKEAVLTSDPVDLDFQVCGSDQPPCTADFTYVTRSDFEVQFFGLSIFQLVESWFWEFGDGTTSIEASPTHHYGNAGRYVVSLRIVTSDSCSAELSKEIFLDTQICNCPEYYFPVCAEDSTGQILSFDNPCFAACAGFDLIMSCNTDCDCQDSDVQPVCVGSFGIVIQYMNACNATCDGFDSFVTCDTTCICPDNYDPVCVLSTSGKVIRFSNACEAQCAGYSDYSKCDSCFCPLFFVSEPVCVLSDDGQFLHFDNPCVAECAGFEDYYLCDVTCDCPLDLEPVCVYTIEGTLRFLNPCHAACLGYPDVFVCDTCECAPIYDPVCVPAPDGNILRFQSLCHAACAGYDAIINCDTTCICTEQYDPVCVLLPDGTTQEFTNACFAECAGFFDFFSCEDSCFCTREYDPVCVLTASGDIIKFSNPCVANCAGYESFIPCELDCYCEGIVDPVCVIRDDGAIVRFESACEAICRGYHIFYDCNILCICPAIFDPVCVVIDDGSVLTFENSCRAECMGYTDYQQCDNSVPDAIASDGNRARRSQSIQVSPNPFDQFFDLQTEVPRAGIYDLKVISTNGQIMQKEKIHSFGIYLQAQVISADIPVGLYILVLENESFRDITRIVKSD